MGGRTLGRPAGKPGPGGGGPDIWGPDTGGGIDIGGAVDTGGPGMGLVDIGGADTGVRGIAIGGPGTIVSGMAD